MKSTNYLLNALVGAVLFNRQRSLTLTRFSRIAPETPPLSMSSEQPWRRKTAGASTASRLRTGGSPRARSATLGETRRVNARDGGDAY